MEVMTVGALGLAAVLLAVQFKTLRSEYAVYIVFAAGLVIAFYTVGRLETVLGLFESFAEALPVDSVYLVTLLKMLGIAYTVQICSGLCKDAGYGAIAGQIETFGKLTILSIGFPVILSLLETIHTFLYEGL